MNKFIESIQRVYPDLIIKDFYFNEIGQNNDLIIVNDSLVFRFPKYIQGVVQLKRETEILKYLEDKVSLPIPVPIFESFDELEPGKVFTGYHLIEGNPLWKKSLLEIKNDDLVKGLASQLASFLISIHSITGETASRVLRLQGRHPGEEMVELYEKIQHKLFPFMRKESQEEVTETFESFLYSDLLSDLEVTLIHGDFGASNILWKQEISEVSGIVDFGGSGIGDPAYDFAGLLSSYGEEFYNICIDQYPYGKEIAKRVHFYKSTFGCKRPCMGLKMTIDRPLKMESKLIDNFIFLKAQKRC